MTAGKPEPPAERVLGDAPARSRAALPSGASWLRVLPWLIAWPALVAMGVAWRRRAGGVARLGMVVLAVLALAACAVEPEEQPAAQEAVEVEAEPAEEPEAQPREEPEEPEPQPAAEPEPVEPASRAGQAGRGPGSAFPRRRPGRRHLAGR